MNLLVWCTLLWEGFKIIGAKVFVWWFLGRFGVSGKVLLGGENYDGVDGEGHGDCEGGLVVVVVLEML